MIINSSNSKAIERFKALEDDFNKVHKNEYTYSNFIYTGMRVKSHITCKVHGDFEQTPGNHLKGTTCPKCAYANNSSVFSLDSLNTVIAKFTSVHNTRYDYSEVDYVKSSIKVKIVCRKHGAFYQTPKAHTQGSGCPQCGRKLCTKNKKPTLTSRPKKATSKVINKKSKLDKFLHKAKEIYGNTYDYSLVQYTHSRTKITIICPTHGEFIQTPSVHLSGSGCKKCRPARNYDSKKYTQQDFIKKARTTHGDTYNYDKVNYIKSKAKVTITCKIHGDFEQLAGQHLLGRGCIKCAHEKLTVYNKINGTKPKNNNSWHYTKWAEIGGESDNFDSYKVYIILCKNESERFIKIGKTFRDVNRRFTKKPSTRMPYEWVLIKEIVGSAEYISKLEKDLHKEFKSSKYTPMTHFDGSNECFNVNILEELEGYIKF